MSTKCSYVYLHNGSNCTHVYADIADPGNVYIEKTLNQNVSVKLGLHELAMLAKSFDLDEFERQASLTDEQIRDFVAKDYTKRKYSAWSDMWYRSICEVQNPSDQDIMDAHFSYLIKIRNKLITLRELMNSEGRVTKHNFGLEDIK